MGRTRNAIVVVGLVAAMSGVGVPPAAATTDTFTGTLSFPCYGCGVVPGGSASFTLGSGASVTVSFTADNGASALCGLGGAATGKFSGAIVGDFTWDQLPGQTLVFSGAATGTGTFVVTSPGGVGNPCGAAVEATIVGELTY